MVKRHEARGSGTPPIKKQHRYINGRVRGMEKSGGLYNENYINGFTVSDITVKNLNSYLVLAFTSTKEADIGGHEWCRG